MSGRVRWQRAGGEWVTGYRKTARRNPRRHDRFADDAAALELRLELPGSALASPGSAGVAGVRIEALGARLFAVVQGHGQDFVCRQAAKLLATLKLADNAQMNFTIRCGEARRAGTLIYVPGASVVIPRFERAALIYALR
jgi:hypothetical protein